MRSWCLLMLYRFSYLSPRHWHSRWLRPAWVRFDHPRKNHYVRGQHHEVAWIRAWQQLLCLWWPFLQTNIRLSRGFTCKRHLGKFGDGTRRRESVKYCTTPPKWWYRHVDESHVCLAREHLTEFHCHLNSMNQHIKFTVEEEIDRSIAFLDTKTTRNTDWSIKTSVYRKATHTDKYLHFNSHHPLQHKRSVARTLLDRAKNIPSAD